MFAVLKPARKAIARLAAASALLLAAACEPVGLTDLGGLSGGPRIDPGEPVQVALLVPRSDPEAASIARSLENAARLAIADLGDTRIDLRVYDTAGSPAMAGQRAQQAVDDGARIILGPLRGEAANAAGLAVLDDGVNVLSFSNNASIAGGNVFVLGPTFRNTADRLMEHARRQGRDSVVIVHSEDVPGRAGRSAIEQAAATSGVRVVGVQSYPLSVEGVVNTAQNVGAVVSGTGASSVFITTDASNAAMPTLLQVMPENGVTPGVTQYIGLTRWDVRPDLFNLPGAEGAWFALPNQAMQASFVARYRQRYASDPHPLAGLAFDGIAAVGALAEQGRRDALTGRALTQAAGFRGTGGVFRLLPNGTNQRALAVGTVRNGQVVILDPAPTSFAGAGF